MPLIVGAVWYNPRFFGQKTEGHGHNKSVYLAAFILGILYSIAMAFQVIHQLHFQSMLMGSVGFDQGTGDAFHDFEFMMAKYKSNYRTFGHGAIHGLLNSICILLPIIAVNGLFEGKTWKYIMTTWGYWAATSILMGAIISQFY